MRQWLNWRAAGYSMISAGVRPTRLPVPSKDRSRVARGGGTLLFSDIGNEKCLSWSDGGGVSVVYEQTGHANGMTMDLDGRLIACEHSNRRVTRRENDGSLPASTRTGE